MRAACAPHSGWLQPVMAKALSATRAMSLRRGSHHMPTSSGRDGTYSKRGHAHARHGGGCGLPALIGACAASGQPQKQRDLPPTRAQSAPLRPRHTM